MKKIVFILLFFISQSCFSNTQSNSDVFFNWAEVQFPQLFLPTSQTSQTFENLWYYRYYSETNNIIAVNLDDKYVYVIGDDTSGILVRIENLQVLMADIGLDFKTETELNNNKVLSLDPQALPVTDGLWYRPEVSVSWQWHLNGVVNTDYQVKIYDIDLFESSPLLINQLKASGSKVICYFSAGSYENYRTDKDKFIPSELGNIMDGWPDEQWLDIRSENVVEIMLSRLDLAVQKGCDGVEPDNMDAYTNNSGFDLNANDQLAFNKLIANESHNRGLSVGLKNDLNQISELVDFFDFSVNEQCYEYDECNTLVPFINKGKPVLNAEYLDEYINDSNAREDLCQIANKQQFSTLILPLDLDDSFRYSCL